VGLHFFSPLIGAVCSTLSLPFFLPPPCRWHLGPVSPDTPPVSLIPPLREVHLTDPRSFSFSQDDTLSHPEFFFTDPPFLSFLFPRYFNLSKDLLFLNSPVNLSLSFPPQALSPSFFVDFFLGVFFFGVLFPRVTGGQFPKWFFVLVVVEYMSFLAVQLTPFVPLFFPTEPFISHNTTLSPFSCIQSLDWRIKTQGL